MEEMKKFGESEIEVIKFSGDILTASPSVEGGPVKTDEVPVE